MHVFSYNFFLGFVTCCVHLPYHEHSFRVWDLSLCYSFLSQGSTVLISSVFYFKTSMFLGFTGMFLGFTGMFLGFTSLCCSNLTGLSLFPHLSSDFYKAKFLKVESWQRVHKFKCFVTYSEIIFPHSCTGLNCHQYCEPIKLKKKKKNCFKLEELLKLNMLRITLNDVLCFINSKILLCSYFNIWIRMQLTMVFLDVMEYGTTDSYLGLGGGKFQTIAVLALRLR